LSPQNEQALERKDLSEAGYKRFAKFFEVFKVSANLPDLQNRMSQDQTIFAFVSSEEPSVIRINDESARDVENLLEQIETGKIPGDEAVKAVIDEILSALVHESAHVLEFKLYKRSTHLTHSREDVLENGFMKLMESIADTMTANGFDARKALAVPPGKKPAPASALDGLIKRTLKVFLAEDSKSFRVAYGIITALIVPLGETYGLVKLISVLQHPFGILGALDPTGFAGMGLLLAVSTVFMAIHIPTDLDEFFHEKQFSWKGRLLQRFGQGLTCSSLILYGPVFLGSSAVSLWGWIVSRGVLISFAAHMGWNLAFVLRKLPDWARPASTMQRGNGRPGTPYSPETKALIKTILNHTSQGRGRLVNPKDSLPPSLVTYLKHLTRIFDKKTNGLLGWLLRSRELLLVNPSTPKWNGRSEPTNTEGVLWGFSQSGKLIPNRNLQLPFSLRNKGSGGASVKLGLPFLVPHFHGRA